MELFRPAGLLQADPDSRDWTRDHGYAQVSSFPFPPLYLGDDLAQLAKEDPDLAPFLHQCLLQFVNHEYGHLSSLDWWKTSSTGTSTRNPPGCGATTPAPVGERFAWRSSMTWACFTGRTPPPALGPGTKQKGKSNPPGREPMKDRLLQLLLKGHTVQDAIAFWELFRRGRFHALLLEPTANTVTQLFRYVITGVSSFLVDFLLLFFLEAAGMHYLPAAACSFTAGTVCNFLLTKFFAFKSINATVGPAVEVLVFCAISVVGLLLTELLMFFFTSHLHVYFMVSKLISSILVFFWNFLARKFILYPGKIHEKV